MSHPRKRRRSVSSDPSRPSAEQSDSQEPSESPSRVSGSGILFFLLSLFSLPSLYIFPRPFLSHKPQELYSPPSSPSYYTYRPLQQEKPAVEDEKNDQPAYPRWVTDLKGTAGGLMLTGNTAVHESNRLAFEGGWLTLQPLFVNNRPRGTTGTPMSLHGFHHLQNNRDPFSRLALRQKAFVRAKETQAIPAEAKFPHDTMSDIDSWSMVSTYEFDQVNFPHKITWTASHVDAYAGCDINDDVIATYDVPSDLAPFLQDFAMATGSELNTIKVTRVTWAGTTKDQGRRRQLLKVKEPGRDVVLCLVGSTMYRFTLGVKPAERWKNIEINGPCMVIIRNPNHFPIRAQVLPRRWNNEEKKRFASVYRAERNMEPPSIPACGIDCSLFQFTLEEARDPNQVVEQAPEMDIDENLFDFTMPEEREL